MISRLHAALTSVILVAVGLAIPCANAQQRVLGSITGTVKDPSGGVIPGVTVQVRDTATNLTVKETTKDNGLYLISNLPPGNYQVTLSKTGFSTEQHDQVLVEGNRTATVDGSLRIGTSATTVEVSATPIRNEVDTTNGYVVDQLTISRTPLGTGSFTQLAILSPGVSADFLNGSGTNAGLGNQSIFANGQRDTSNSFSLNGISTNNLFNGKSSSQVAGNRFVLNTGENFASSGGDIATSSSVYDAIGQSLPTPAPESLQEIHVDTSMYDASEGANSGAHIGLTTKSGTNEFHGELYEYFQNNALNAAPTFRNADPSIPQHDKVPALHSNRFGATFGGPIKKNKLFFFTAYQGTRITDELQAAQYVTVPQYLTNDRSPTGLVAAANASFGSNLDITQVDPTALKILQAKVNGQYLIPSANIGLDTANALGYNAFIQGPAATANYDQGSVSVDYNISDADRLSVKYFVQNDPTTSPFSNQSNALGFPQALDSGAQSSSIDNSVILSPRLTWEQRIGFVRERAFSHTGQVLSAQDIGVDIFGSKRFPGFTITTADSNLGNGFSFGPSNNFANAGFFQNNWEYGTTVGWQVGRHNLTFGFNWDYTQENVVNQNNQVAGLSFLDFTTFLQGQIRTGPFNSYLFSGSSNRYYRSNTAGAFVNDQYRLRSNLSISLGLRYDYDGPLSEKYGNLTNFYSDLYKYDAATDTILNSGVVFAGNNKSFHTPGVSDSTMKGNQGGFAPRTGIAWSPTSKLTVRTGFGLYYDRGEFFSELSPSAGGGYNGPFGVTLQPPFVVPVTVADGASLSKPFGTTPPPLPPTNASAFQSLLPNIAQLTTGNFPPGNYFGPYAFGGYDANNRLPYSENWTFDLQYQPINNLLFDLGYVGNRGVHQVLPIPFNQPGIATPQHPINGQNYSYGYNATNDAGQVSQYEPIASYTGGNTDLRVPYVGFSPNSVLYKAEGVSSYNALQFQLRKRLSAGLQITASYTWSHSLDEQSGLGLFYNGNDPLNPHSGYASSDFDRTHVFIANYLYQVPKFTHNGRIVNTLASNWFIAGQTIAQSGQPYNVYDYTGSVGSLFYSNNDGITNPTVPLKSGVTVSQAQLQGNFNPSPGRPVLDKNAFTIPTLAPGRDGVPPCDSNG
ncbi:MAG: TonB-dependent receptor, partial [Acidobacteriota bacterium]|nr:TonB-dependent receptor [Acidobacteriota bacterium]